MSSDKFKTISKKIFPFSLPSPFPHPYIQVPGGKPARKKEKEIEQKSRRIQKWKTT